jgi:hypothetical protein
MPMSLEQSIQFFREQITQDLDAARRWKSQNNRGQELFCLYYALQHSLCVAVSGYETPQSGIEYLKTEFKPRIFDQTLELIRELHLKSSIPPQNIGAPSIFQLVLAVHSAWLLDLYTEAKEIASICDDKEQMRLYQRGGLWSDYAQGITAIAYQRQFMPKQKKYKGYDRHYAVYLQLMGDICTGHDLSSAITAVDQSFLQRNRDKRLTNEGLDGDGTFPVKWDFRKHSFLLATKHNASNAG